MTKSSSAKFRYLRFMKPTAWWRCIIYIAAQLIRGEKAKPRAKKEYCCRRSWNVSYGDDDDGMWSLHSRSDRQTVLRLDDVFDEPDRVTYFPPPIRILNGNAEERLFFILSIISPTWSHTRPGVTWRDQFFCFNSEQISNSLAGPVPSVIDWKYREYHSACLILKRWISRHDFMRTWFHATINSSSARLVAYDHRSWLLWSSSTALLSVLWGNSEGRRLFACWAIERAPFEHRNNEKKYTESRERTGGREEHHDSRIRSRSGRSSSTIRRPSGRDGRRRDPPPPSSAALPILCLVSVCVCVRALVTDLAYQERHLFWKSFNTDQLVFDFRTPLRLARKPIPSNPTHR